MNLKRANFVQPSAVQRRMIPVIMQGVDVMACAQTGSGKTVRFQILSLFEMLSLQLKVNIGEKHFTDNKRKMWRFEPLRESSFPSGV